MEDGLRHDLMAIILEEAFGMRSEYAEQLLSGKVTYEKRSSFGTSLSKADSDARDAADTIIDRMASRCSRIEG